MDTRTPLSEGMDFAAAQLASTIQEVVKSYCQGKIVLKSTSRNFLSVFGGHLIFVISLVEKWKDLSFVYRCKIPLS